MSRLSLESAPDIDAVVEIHNQNIDQLKYALTKLRFSENFDGKLLAIQVTMPDLQWIDVASTAGFQSGWVNYNTATDYAAAYRALPEGRVRMRGLVKSGTVGSGNPIFTLPAAYAPKFFVHRVVDCNGAFGQLIIRASGAVELWVGSNAYASLDAEWDAVLPAPSPRQLNPQGVQNTSGVPGWPIQVAHGLKTPCVGLWPIACRMEPAQGITQVPEPGYSVPIPALDWEDSGKGQVRIKAVYGLTPGKRYIVTCVAIAG